MNGGCLFIALTKAAILGVNKSNDWAFAYITGVLQDIFILQILKNLWKITLVNKSLKGTSGMDKFILKLIGSDPKLINLF